MLLLTYVPRHHPYQAKSSTGTCDKEGGHPVLRGIRRDTSSLRVGTIRKAGLLGGLPSTACHSRAESSSPLGLRRRSHRYLVCMTVINDARCVDSIIQEGGGEANTGARHGVQVTPDLLIIRPLSMQRWMVLRRMKHDTSDFRE